MKYFAILILSFLVSIIYYLTKNKSIMNKNTLDPLLDRAKLFEGIHELGKNKAFENKEFQDLLSKHGWVSGYQWCAFYVKMVFCTALPQYADCFKKVLTGSSQGTFNNAKAGKCQYLKAISTGNVQPGDIVVFQNYKDPAYGHVGICLSVDGDTAYLIEGNANVGGFKGEKEKVDIVPHKNITIGLKSNTYKTKKIRGFVRFSE